MVVGDVLDQALEQDRVVTRLERIGHVVQVDFELSRGAFLDDGVGRNALLLGRFQHVLQAVGVLVQIIDQVHLGRLRALAGDRGARWLRTAIEVVPVDQVELELEGCADIQAQLVEFGDHLTQHFTWVGEEWGAVQLMHGHQQLSSGALLPRLVGQSAGDRIADAVSIADVQAKAGALDGRAVDIQGEQRRRQVDAFLVYLVQAGALDALAAYHTVHIGNQQIDELRVRMSL